MKSRKARWLWILLLTALIALLAAACGSSSDGGEGGDVDGEALVAERCVDCHDLSRVTSARKTEEGWQATVERMVDLGARLNEAEQEAVVDYLAETYPE